MRKAIRSLKVLSRRRFSQLALGGTAGLLLCGLPPSRAIADSPEPDGSYVENTDSYSLGYTDDSDPLWSYPGMDSRQHFYLDKPEITNICMVGRLGVYNIANNYFNTYNVYTMKLGVSASSRLLASNEANPKILSVQVEGMANVNTCFDTVDMLSKSTCLPPMCTSDDPPATASIATFIMKRIFATMKATMLSYAITLAEFTAKARTDNSETTATDAYVKKAYNWKNSQTDTAVHIVLHPMVKKTGGYQEFEIRHTVVCHEEFVLSRSYVICNWLDDANDNDSLSKMQNGEEPPFYIASSKTISEESYYLPKGTTDMSVITEAIDSNIIRSNAIVEAYSTMDQDSSDFNEQILSKHEDRAQRLIELKESCDANQKNRTEDAASILDALTLIVPDICGD